jgi:hypothetical protein
MGGGNMGVIFGTVLFMIGVTLILIGLAATMGFTSVITGTTIVWFIIFGFVLCVTGFFMTSAMRAAAPPVYGPGELAEWETHREEACLEEEEER